MKKLLALIAAVTAAVALAAAPAAGGTADTGTYGPAEEPTWVVPLVVAFVVLCVVAAFLSARRSGSDTTR